VILSTDPPCRFLMKAPNSCRFLCSRVSLSAPHDKTLYCCPTSLVPLYISLSFHQFLSAKCFFLAFQLKKGDFAGGRICHLFSKTNEKGLQHFVSFPLFLFIPMHLCSLHPRGVSSSNSGLRAFPLSSGTRDAHFVGTVVYYSTLMCTHTQESILF